MGVLPAYHGKKETEICEQQNMQSHEDRNRRSNTLHHPIPIYRHRVNQSQYRPVNNSTGVWQDSHLSTNLQVTGMPRPWIACFDTRVCRSRGERHSARLPWRCVSVRLWESACNKSTTADKLQQIHNYRQPKQMHAYSTDRLKGRGVEKVSGPHSTLQGLELSVFYQANIETVSRATLGRLLRDGAERVWGFPSAAMPS